ncbi:FAD-binding oxidoreductase [Haloarcula marina]|uniref:FAD-binding oxidoreductase n=1 Tax=Haloarcula marina TaxID=2961574 RepID=UPI0020B65E40|nr:FAD-binding oxidoreductase [Halomicroarcula marina]
MSQRLDDSELTERIDDLRAAFRGEILRPDDEGYEEVRSVWNGMIDRRPAVITRATGTADVVAAVDFAREAGLELSIHGGGHNAAGNAVTDGGLMLDLSPMDGVFVDPAARTAWVGGGATLGDIDSETQLFDLAAPLGVVSETGVAGLTLNGGYGHLSREFGLAADNVVSAQVVTADGAVRIASEDTNEDLFWAIRGGGGNFGVVTAFQFRLHDIGPEVYGFFPWFHGDDARTVLEGFREWTEDAPRHASAIPFVAHVPELEEFPEAAWGEPAVALLGAYRGDDFSQAPVVYEPILERATPLADLSGPMNFVDLQSMLDEDYPDGMRYYWKSIFVAEASDEVFDIMVEYNESAPSDLSTVDLWHLGGAVADRPQDATAFYHRDKPFMVTFEANWEDPEDDDANIEWAREGFAALESLDIASGRYGNFPGFADDPATMLFGDNYERLVDVKTEYDPENLFRLNQNIAPRGWEEGGDS